jgi:glycosyltransferase involved in cell wall biosynthesis
MRTANILYVHQDGLLTGSAFSLRNLLVGLDRKRFQPTVLLAREGPARQLYEALDIPVDVIPIHGMWTFPGPPFPKPDYFRNWLALFPNRELDNYLKKKQPALVHVNDKTILPAGVSAKRLGLPVVWHIRSSYAVSHSRLQARVSASIIRRTADHLIVISEDEIDGFEDFPNLKIIYNSVDFTQVEHASLQRTRIRAELGLESDEILVGTVSTSLNENRGSWDFIRAAGFLQTRLPNTHFRFVIVARIPDPSTEAEAWQRAEEAGVRGQLTLTGFRSDALALMAAMDVVAICTRRGVLGRMPFEVMALGRPLVVTAGHSGRSRVVVDGETALVVPPADPEAISGGIVRLLQSRELSQKLSRQGALYARQHFESQKNTRSIMEIYEKVLRHN